MVNLFSTGSKKKKEPAVDDHQLARPTGVGNNAPAARKSAALTIKLALYSDRPPSQIHYTDHEEFLFRCSPVIPLTHVV